MRRRGPDGTGHHSTRHVTAKYVTPTVSTATETDSNVLAVVPTDSKTSVSDHSKNELEDAEKHTLHLT